MFSNRFRMLKIIICITVIGLACIYSGTYGPDNNISMEQIVADSEKYNGKTIGWSFRLVTKVDKNEIEFKDGGKNYKAIILDADNSNIPAINDYISFEGIFNDGVLNIPVFHIHHYRRLKIIISFCALVGVIIYCLSLISVHP